MNERQTRRANRKEKRKRGFAKLAGRGISKAVKQALAAAEPCECDECQHLIAYSQEAFDELVDKIKTEV